MPDGQLEEGSLLNERYRILRVIGQGGMGTVYQAEHERLNAIVAVKEIRGTPATGTAQQATMDQYEQEARFLVRLNHPNLPKVTDAFVDGGRFYLVMDFVDGVTLENRLRTNGGSPIDPEMVVDWAIEIADVLGYLHTQVPPIIFRDLKPSNVMVQPDGHTKLIDFGIARRFQPGASKDTALLGSVGYSPPEQFGRHQTDTRSDIYALGATMHHLLTACDPGKTPFKFVPIERISLGAPPALSRLIIDCLAMDPEQRPQTVAEVLSELYAIHDDLHHVGIPTRSTSDDAVGRAASGKIKPGDRQRPSGSAKVSIGAPAPTSSRGSDRKLRVAVTFVGLILIGGVVYTVHSATAHHSTVKHPVSPPTVTGGVTPAQSVDPNSVAGKINPAGPAGGPSGGGSGGAATPQSGGVTEPPAPGTDGGAPPVNSKAAECSVEVLGASPDGKSVRLHVTGEITGRKDTAGMVAAYFYNADKSPLPARDPKSAYATPSGQLFAEFTFQIDADSKPIDGLIDVPADQFTSTNNLLFRCIVYSDNQSAGQTDLLPLSSN